MEILKKDISMLIEHLEARGVVVDTILMDHLVKLNKRLDGHSVTVVPEPPKKPEMPE